MESEEKEKDPCGPGKVVPLPEYWSSEPQAWGEKGGVKGNTRGVI